MNDIYQPHTDELIAVLEKAHTFHYQLSEIVIVLKNTFTSGNKLLIAGNGGSAAQAQHLSDEMVGKYKNDRRSYPAIALSADGAVVTCIGNDYGYDQVFARQVEGLGKEGDVLIGLSTSGNSANIIAAAKVAQKKNMTTIAFTGQQGKLKAVADYVLAVESKTGARIQEMHLHAIHLLCEEFEN